MYSNILIAVDLAGEAEPVLRAGRDIAERYGADYHAIYCVDQPIMPFGELSNQRPLFNMAQLKHEILPHFKEAAKRASFDCARVSIEIGHPAEAILAKAETDNCDLIVIGSHGKRGLRALLGSTANSVLHHAQCNVLAVRVTT